jgi:hypothetical protein
MASKRPEAFEVAVGLRLVGGGVRPIHIVVGRGIVARVVTGIGRRVVTGIIARVVTGIGSRVVAGIGSRVVAGIGSRVVTGIVARVVTGIGSRVIAGIVARVIAGVVARVTGVVHQRRDVERAVVAPVVVAAAAFGRSGLLGLGDLLIGQRIDADGDVALHALTAAHVWLGMARDVRGLFVCHGSSSDG